MKKLVFFALVFMVLLSGCSKADEASVPVEETTTTTETITETTTEPTTITTTEPTTVTTEIALTPEEMEIYNTMPDIVFVLAHCYNMRSDEYSNIRGFYVTKDGKVKMYAFSDEEPEKYRDIFEVYDELENVTCSEFYFENDEHVFKQDDLDTISKKHLIVQYQKLMLADKRSPIRGRNTYLDWIVGDYDLYGIRTKQDGTKEIIYLSGWGDYYYINTDTYADEIYKDLDNIFPNVHFGSRHSGKEELIDDLPDETYDDDVIDINEMIYGDNY